MEIGIDITDVQKLAAVMDRASRAGPVAVSALLNNLAFGARKTALSYIPRVMHVRNKGFLAASILIRKATPNHLEATFYSRRRDRFTGLYEEEFGGTMQRHPASKAARGGSEQGKIKSGARLQPGDIITPDDVRIAHNKGTQEQFIKVYLKQIMTGKLGTGTAGQRFILHTTGKWIWPGLKRTGKLAPGTKRKRVSGRAAGAKRNAQRHGYISIINDKREPWDRLVVGLQSFDTKGKAKVERRPWMWVSVQRYLSYVRLEVTWQRTLEKLMQKAGAKRA